MGSDGDMMNIEKNSFRITLKTADVWQFSGGDSGHQVLNAGLVLDFAETNTSVSSERTA